jgi:hypothetical protein
MRESTNVVIVVVDGPFRGEDDDASRRVAAPADALRRDEYALRFTFSLSAASPRSTKKVDSASWSFDDDDDDCWCSTSWLCRNSTKEEAAAPEDWGADAKQALDIHIAANSTSSTRSSALLSRRIAIVTSSR